jgi:hypothetical protein
MATKTKIKIIDNSGLRSEIDKLYEQTSQINLAKWAIKCAKHILSLADPGEINLSSIENGFITNELWQSGKASVHEVRQAGFKIHEIARQCKSETAKNAIRTAGQAVGVGHMREHAMVCSDYATKTIQLIFPEQIAPPYIRDKVKTSTRRNFHEPLNLSPAKTSLEEKISEERQWQLKELKKINQRGKQKMKTITTHDERIAKMTFASVYPFYIAKVEKKGRSKEELNMVITWLTGFDEKKIQQLIDEKVTFEIFFKKAKLNKNAHLITGVICGYRVEEITNPLIQKVRYLDKLVDELAKGKKMDKILRTA